ncbi:hypothetical protein E2C01_009155 [Portunus trituberculatus]|uniref:Uncharacterized protein n=1 Tax=Portunus trituberculatus TaxID=210409 RepID=A0A5B7D4L8_PORTR|nr:hypothetical protein [Portunus trituberculatus]
MHQISDVCSGGSLVLCERSRRHVVLLFPVVTGGYGCFMNSVIIEGASARVRPRCRLEGCAGCLNAEGEGRAFPASLYEVMVLGCVSICGTTSNSGRITDAERSSSLLHTSNLCVPVEVARFAGLARRRRLHSVFSGEPQASPTLVGPSCSYVLSRCCSACFGGDL